MITLNNIDITSLVDIPSIVTNDTLDESLASGSMVIPLSTQSEPYARFSEVNIDGLLYVVAEDTVKLIKRVSPKLYRHEISLIEPTKILQKRVIPNMTVTQPKGDYTQYVFSIFKTSTSPELIINNSLTTLSLAQTSGSQDTNVINGLTLKNTQEYEIYTNFTLRNKQINSALLSTIDGNVTIEFTTFYGSTLIDTKTFTVNAKRLFGSDIIYQGGYLKKYTPATINQTLSVKARTLGTYNIDGSLVQDAITIDEFVLKPSQKTNVGNDKITLDTVVDKILAFHPTFTLADSTRERIAQYTAPEFTFQNYTMYDALKEVANFVGAIVYLGESDFTTVHFYFYDTPLTDTLDFADQEQVEYLADFADGLEINAVNVIREDNPLYTIHEPTADTSDWLTVRGVSDERGSQIANNTTAISLQHPIYKINQVVVRGLAFTMYANGTAKTGAVNFPNTQVWDITNYIFEQQRYNTFDVQAQTSVNIRGSFKNKSNTVYYTQGGTKVLGLGFQGSKPPAWIKPQSPNFAIIEAILNKAAEDNPTLEFEEDYLLDTSPHLLQFRVSYIPYSDVRLTVYKKQGDNIMYFNERDALNDMELLGKIAQENAERTGNRITRLQGLTYDDRLLLGSKQDNGVLVNYTISRTPTINKFTAEYAVGYANISNYVGVDSKYRQYEVPTDTIVNRRDKLTTFLSLNISNTIPNPTHPSYMTSQLFSGLWGNFRVTPSGFRPTHGKLIMQTTDGVKVVESTIDAYRMGRTLGLAVDMLDNYSAGIKKVTKDFVGINNVKVQEDTPYTDGFGNFSDINIRYHNISQVDTIAEGDLYPENNIAISLTNKGFDYTYTVNKDARERYGFVWELVFFDGSIKVYDGFVKFNRLASGLTSNRAEFRLLQKGYIPTRDLDISRTVLTGGSITQTGTNAYATLIVNAHPSGEYEGLVITINEEPILVWQTDILDIGGVPTTRYIYTEEV